MTFGAVAFLSAVVLSHVDGDTLWVRAPLPHIRMETAACKALFADQRNSPELYPSVYVTPECTVIVLTKIRIRGIDTPEGDRPRCALEKKRAAAATQALATLLPRDTQVTLAHVTADKYGDRMVAKVVKADETDIGAALLTAGHAVSYSGRGPRKNWCVP